MSNIAGIIECHAQNCYKIRWKFDDFKFLHNAVSAYRNSPQFLESAPFKMWDFNWKFKMLIIGEADNVTISVCIFLKTLEEEIWVKKGLSISASLNAIHKSGVKSKNKNCSGVNKDNKILFVRVFSFASITQQIRQDFVFNWKIWLNGVSSTRSKREVLNAKRIKLMVNKLGVMLDDKESHDVKIRCQGVELSAHKVILSAMFQAGMKESRESMVEVTVGSPEAVKVMLRWIYGSTGDIEEKESHALDLLKLAHYYDLAELMEECQLILMDTLCKENVIEMLNEADLMGAKDLKDSAIQLIIRNKSEFKEDLETKLKQKLVVEILLAHKLI